MNRSLIFRPLLSNVSKILPNSRGLFTIIPDYANQTEELKEFGNRVQVSACDEYPGFRKERRKPKEWRFFRENRKLGKISNHKVRGIVELITFQRAYKLF